MRYTGKVTKTDEEHEGCNLEGCPGHLIIVHWDDGGTSWECSRAVRWITDDAVCTM